MNKHNFIRKMTALLVGTLFVRPVLAHGGWYQEQECWKYEQQGQVMCSCWVEDAGNRYYLDGQGVMLTGWQFLDGHWYFLNPVSDGTKGRMLTGWQWVDGKCYYLSPEQTQIYPLGAMVAGTTTPDGYLVDDAGAWVDDAGKVVFVAGKGYQTSNETGASAVAFRASGGGGATGIGNKGTRGGSKSSGDEGKTSGGEIKVFGSDEPSDIILSEGTISGVVVSDIPLSDDRPSDVMRSEDRMSDVEVSSTTPLRATPSNVVSSDEVLSNATLSNAALSDETLRGELPVEGNERLLYWLEVAAAMEAELTGEDLEKIPCHRFIVEDAKQGEERVLSAASQIIDSEEHILYVIGKNTIPSGVILKIVYGDQIRYSNLTEEVIAVGDDVYTVCRFALVRTFHEDGCLHQWEVTTQSQAGCLHRGRQVYFCPNCAMEEEIIIAALGHADADGDSVCDRCRNRAFAQSLGDAIKVQAALEGGISRELTFVCVDEDYQGGMLYVSREAIPLSDFGGYGSFEYSLSNPGRYFADGWQNGCSITGLMPISIENQVGYGAVLDLETAQNYLPVMGGDYLTRTTNEDGSRLQVLCSDGSVVEWLPGSEMESEDANEHPCYGIRPAILLAMPDEGAVEEVHWKIGDVQAREITGETYLFRCIDQNYSDALANHREAALFLCDSVIPANTGSQYHYEKLPDGTYGYVFEPGPVVNFGNSNDYKYSHIRKWLQRYGEDFFHTEDISIGNGYAYLGSTEKGTYEQLKESLLVPSYIGSQLMTDRLFILSVDEALKYRDWLWRFDGAEENNPETQTGMFAKAYWLRSPVGTAGDCDTDLAYVVDLDDGNIRPEAIMPEGKAEDEELQVTSAVGIRPAFAVPQD